MRYWIRTLAFIPWVMMALLAVAGFATFTPTGPPQAEGVLSPPAVPSPDGGGGAAGRVAALALTEALSPDGVLETRTYPPAFEGLGPDGATTSTSSSSTTAPTTTSTAALVPITTVPPRSQPKAPDASNSFGPCTASFYGDAFQGQRTSSGEPYDPNDFTAAHPSLAFATVATVTRSDTGASVTVRINDRGPYVGDRCIDLSKAAMGAIGGLGVGLVSVVVTY